MKNCTECKVEFENKDLVIARRYEHRFDDVKPLTGEEERDPITGRFKDCTLFRIDRLVCKECCNKLKKNES
jgi:hypothetical protein